MLSRFFKKSIAVRHVEQVRDEIEFVEPVTGSGLDALRMELVPRLQRFKCIENGYLPKLHYYGESESRTCLLLIEQEPIARKQKEEVAAACAGIIPMDICFASDLPRELVSKVTALCRPVILPGLALFECPLIVKRGLNLSMPAEWPMGVSFWYVAAATFEDALRHAVGSAKAEGFEFINVYQGKVVQIDHAKWWDGVVMKQWHAYSDHLPSQQQIEAAVATGGIVRGPTIGPLSNSDA